MRFVLLLAALFVSLWPAAAIVFAVDRVVLGGDDSADETALTRTAPTKRRVAEAEAASSGGTTTTPADLIELNELRDDTRNLLAALGDSTAAVGVPDTALAADAVELEAELSAWRRANRGRNDDAEDFARLFSAIAASTADFAAAPTEANRRRVERAVARHRRETFQ